ncbi:MAG: hypothetical protein WCS15_04325 [Prevotella sp.]
MTDYLSISDFAARAGVTKQAIYKRVDKDLQPFVQLVDGKKAIYTSALQLFQSTESTPTVDQHPENKLNELNRPLIELYQQQIEMLNNQLVETVELLKSAQEENRKLTDQLIALSGDFSGLAQQSNMLVAQAHDLHWQAQIQAGKLVESSEQPEPQVEQPKRSWLSKLFK